MNTEMVKKDFLRSARRYESAMIKHQRFLHKNAEVGLDLPVTTSYIMEKLTRMGYAPKEICRSGIVAVAGGKRPGSTFLLRGDTDALPLSEETDLPYKAVNGNMHACGHDFHAAMLLGAAMLLKEVEDDIPGTVKLMFQPGEEIASGAQSMIASGVLEQPKVDAAMMLHVLSGFPIPLGHACFFQAGPCFSSIDVFEITIQGKGGHGAMPNYAIDPLVAMSHIHLGIQSINSREIGAGKFLVATTGKMGGGNAFNVIPDTAHMAGTIRAFDADVRLLAKRRIKEIAEGVGTAYRCGIKVKYSLECPSFINDTKLLKKMSQYITDLQGPDRILEGASVGLGRIPGSEDFAFVSEKVPSVVIAIGGGVNFDGVIYPQHHPKVKFDESVLVTGAAIYAHCAFSWLKDNQTS